MSNIKVVDMNEEGDQEQPETQNEAVTETELTPEAEPEVTEEDNKNTTLDIDKEITTTNQSEKVEPKPKRQTQKDKMDCPKCLKPMTVKSYKYTHEKNCKGPISERPVKPHSKPRAKPKPKPQPLQDVTGLIYQPPQGEAVTGLLTPQGEAVTNEVVNEVKQDMTRQVTNNVVKSIPPNPITSLAQHYQLLQQEYIKQKQEKYNNLCKNMFMSKRKKK